MRIWSDTIFSARVATVVLVLVLASWAVVPLAALQTDADTRDPVERSVELMGGEDALRGVQRVTLRMMTQWQRPDFRGIPNTDRPSFEPHLDVRDYTIPAWRNTREFGNQNVVNVVRDSVALTDFGQGFQPLSVAYVDERAELFTYTPDRLLLALLNAPDRRVIADTLLGGEPHHAVSATLNGRFPATVFFHKQIGLPTMLHFRAGHPNDFGLVPWGEMNVEVWYSNWRTFGDISIPTQWDIERVGEPYKRMTVREAVFNPDISADSFAVSVEQRDTYANSLAPLPMHEGVQIQSTSLPNPSVAMIQSFGTASGAVDIGSGWLMLGAGHSPFNYNQSVQALYELGVDEVAAVLIGNGSTGNGGVTAAVEEGLPIYVSGASKPFVEMMLKNSEVVGADITVIDEVMQFGDGMQQIQLAPLGLPDIPGSLMVFQPESGWLFLPDGRNALDIRIGRERAEQLGWDVRTVGTPRAFYPKAGG